MRWAVFLIHGDISVYASYIVLYILPAHCFIYILPVHWPSGLGELGSIPVHVIPKTLKSGT